MSSSSAMFKLDVLECPPLPCLNAKKNKSIEPMIVFKKAKNRLVLSVNKKRSLFQSFLKIKTTAELE
jgi:hypothetical protein